MTMGYVNVIWQRDAVDHILQAVSLAASPTSVVNVAGLPIVSVRELARRFEDLLDRDPMIVGTEEPTAWLSNPAKAHDLFGSPLVNLDEAIEWTAAWIAAGARRSASRRSLNVGTVHSDRAGRPRAPHGHRQAS